MPSNAGLGGRLLFLAQTPNQTANATATTNGAVDSQLFLGASATLRFCGRIAAELQREGLRVGRTAVRTVLRAQGLRAIQPKQFVPKTTNSRHGQTASPNLLAKPEHQATKAAQVIVGDITYLPLLTGGWCYLAVWQDKFTRRVIGWAVEALMTDDLVIKALEKAARNGFLKPGAIVHTSPRFAICLAGFSLSAGKSQVAAINVGERQLL